MTREQEQRRSMEIAVSILEHLLMHEDLDPRQIRHDIGRAVLSLQMMLPPAGHDGVWKPQGIPPEGS